MDHIPYFTLRKGPILQNSGASIRPVGVRFWKLSKQRRIPKPEPDDGELSVRLSSPLLLMSPAVFSQQPAWPAQLFMCSKIR